MFLLMVTLASSACRSEPPRVDSKPAPVSALGGTRPVRHFSAASTNEPAPLIVVLHGYGGDATDVLSWSGLASLSSKGVHVIAPDGTFDSTGRRFWNANTACCDFEQSHVDDVSYLRSLVDEVAARVKVDAKRIYAVGLSNGGAMSMRLACDAADRFAAVVSFSGPSAPEEPCTPKLPVSVRLLHGTDDRVVPFGGGNRLAPVHPKAKGTLAAVPDLFKAWAAREGCSGEPAEAETLDFVGMLPGKETRLTKFASCTGGAVELAIIQGGGHVPPLNARFVESTWSFLSSHSR
jgi:polyhydroxybutyrate depolymerase